MSVDDEDERVKMECQEEKKEEEEEEAVVDSDDVPDEKKEVLLETPEVEGEVEVEVDDKNNDKATGSTKKGGEKEQDEAPPLMTPVSKDETVTSVEEEVATTVAVAADKNDDAANNSVVPVAFDEDYYTIFQILNMIGYLCHNRRYWRADVGWSLGILTAYIILGSPSKQRGSKATAVVYRNYIFLIHLLFMLYTWIPKMPHGANHKNMMGVATSILLPQQIQRCFFPSKTREQANNINKASNGALNVLRWAIVMMYFFAGFHKINTDFLFEPTVTCAYDKVYYYMELVGYDDLENLPWWMNASVPPMVLFIEMGPAIGLIYHGGNVQLQSMCVANFIFLHLILLPMGFADFGTIAQSFLILFIHPTVLTVRSQLPLHYYFYMAGVYIFFEGLALARWYLTDEDDEQMFETVCGLVLMGHGIMWASIFLVGLQKEDKEENDNDNDNVNQDDNVDAIKKKEETATPPPSPPSSLPQPVEIYFPKSLAGRCTIGFFFFFVMNPYLGLRTAGNLTMFSNLRTEGSTSNHLLFKNNPLKIFNYQDDVVDVLEVDDRWDIPRFGEGDLVPRIMFDVEFRSFCDWVDEHVEQYPENKEDWDDVYMLIQYNGTLWEAEDMCNDPKWNIFRKKRPIWEEMFLNMRRIQKDGPKQCSW